MSDSTASAIPGYWTLTATSAPVGGAPAVDLADAGRGGRLGVELGEHPLGRLAPLGLEHPADLLPLDRGDVVAQRGEPLLQVLGLVGVEPGKLDRREHLAGLHRRAAHDRELVDQRVDRRHHAVAAAALALLVGAAGVEPVAGPARGAAGRDAAELRGPRDPSLGRPLGLRLVGLRHRHDGSWTFGRGTEVPSPICRWGGVERLGGVDSESLPLLGAADEARPRGDAEPAARARGASRGSSGGSSAGCGARA